VEDEKKIPESLREVPASEILAKIEKGKPVDYENIIAKGDFLIKNLNLPMDNEKFIIHSAIIIKDSIIEGVFIFNNAIFEDYINFSGTVFSRFANFEGSEFDTSIDFTRSNFGEVVFFREAHFDDATIFDDTKFDWADFSGSKFREFISFQGCKFSGFANFGLSVFSNIASFKKVRFGVESHFRRSKFGTYVDFSEAFFARTAEFRESKIRGELTFRNANFDSPLSQEIACRKAKNAYEKNGNKGEAEYHFYREMEAIRKRRGFFFSEPDYFPKETIKSLRVENWEIIKRILWYDALEYFLIQLIFGYGVHPKRLMIAWGAIVIAFSLLYWIGNGMSDAVGWFDYLKFSFATAMAPGYIATIISPGSTGYRLIPEYQAAAMAESIFGTFLWAGFIATFARKYMR